jgi:hypothetical protein
MRFWSKVRISRSLMASAALLGALVFGVGSGSVAAISSYGLDGVFGQVTGRLVRVGGPAPGPAVGIPGRVGPWHRGGLSDQVVVALADDGAR